MEDEMKRVRLRLGVTLLLSKSEFEAVVSGGEEGKGIILDKFVGNKCILSGESFIPKQEYASDADWKNDRMIVYRF